MPPESAWMETRDATAIAAGAGGGHLVLAAASPPLFHTLEHVQLSALRTPRSCGFQLSLESAKAGNVLTQSYYLPGRFVSGIV
jgi:hypothetical protein